MRCKIFDLPCIILFNQWANLESLDVTRSTFASNLELFGVVKLCSSVTSLNLDGVKADDHALCNISKRLLHLQYLVLNTRSAYEDLMFTEMGLKKLLKHCIQLKRITLFGAPPNIVTLLGPRLV